MTYSKHGINYISFNSHQENEAKGSSYKIMKWTKEKLLWRGGVQWHYATRREVSGSITGGVLGNYQVTFLQAFSSIGGPLSL
jgi:hypothetical protein